MPTTNTKTRGPDMAALEDWLNSPQGQAATNEVLKDIARGRLARWKKARRKWVTVSEALFIIFALHGEEWGREHPATEETR